MMLRLILLCLFSFGVVIHYCKGGLAIVPDSTQIKLMLDSAATLVGKRDRAALSLLAYINEESRKINFQKGEAESIYLLGHYFKNTNNYDSALFYYNSAYRISASHNSIASMAQCLNATGVLKFQAGKFSDAVIDLSKALELFTRLDNQRKISNVHAALGVTHQGMGDYAKALDHYLKALSINEQQGLTSYIPYDLASIGILYDKRGEPAKALEYLEKAVESARGINDDYTLAGMLINLGVQQKKNGLLNEAEKTYKEGVKLTSKLGDNQAHATLLHNMGALHHAKGNFNRALDYYHQSLEIPSINTKELQLVNFIGMSEAYQELGQPENALRYALQSEAIAQETRYREKIVESTKLLSSIYKQMGDYESSLRYHELFAVHKDSLLNSEKTKQIEELQARYEADKKQQQIETLNRETEVAEAQIRQKTITQYVLAAGFVLFAVLMVVVFRNHRIKQEGKRLLLAEQLRYEKLEADRLKELDQLKSRFFANVAHEFRTPLTLILGPIENMIVDVKSLQLKSQLVVVKNSALRLIQLVNQLLDLSKLEAGAAKLHLSKEDVILFLKAHTYSFQSLAEQRNISLSFISDLERLEMAFDRDKVEKILSNILSNALKFTPARGDVMVSVTVEVDGPAETLLVSVKDSGPGIPPEDIPHVFNRFYQSGKVVARGTQGSGIGLELCKELVELSGGTIGVSSPEGEGTEFFFTLPVRKEGVTLAVSEAEAPRPVFGDTGIVLPLSDQGNEPSSASEIVLIIEDNDDVRNYVVNALRPSFQVVEASDGQSGIDKALEIIPDIILSDVMMPGMDGYDVCKTIKNHESTSHIPLVLLTSKADLESKIEGLELGADDYLSKPFHTTELLTRLRNLIAQRRKLQEKYGSMLHSDDKKHAEILPSKEQLFLDKLRKVVELHLAEEEYSVEDLSREMGMSRTQLHRKVKALTNHSISIFMRTVRLEHAHRLLQEGLYNVSEVAYRVGFNSATYFATCFAEHFGVPPSELRAERMV